MTRAELERAGLGRGAIAHRVKEGRLHRLHRGVYAVGHAAHVPLARELAAVLACGSGAVLCHESAAADLDGSARLRLAAGAGTPRLTRSEAERRLLRLLDPRSTATATTAAVRPSSATGRGMRLSRQTAGGSYGSPGTRSFATLRS